MSQIFDSYNVLLLVSIVHFNLHLETICKLILVSTYVDDFSGDMMFNFL